MQQFSEIVRPDSATLNRLRSGCLHRSDESGIVETMSSAVTPHNFALVGTRSPKVNLWYDSLDLGGVSLHYVDYNCDAQRITVSSQNPVEGIVLKFPLATSSQVNVNDREYLVNPGEFSVLNSATTFQTTMDGESNHLALVLENNWLQQYYSEQKRRFHSKSLTFKDSAYSMDKDGVLLSGLLTSLVLSMTRHDYTVTTVDDVSQHMKKLITAVIVDLAQQVDNTCSNDCISNLEPRFLGEAEDYMRENLSEEINVEGVARQVGVSRRTLHAGFRRYRSNSPMAILKSLRLEAVQTAFESARHNGRSVTEIATYYGFLHLGRFSQEYRDAFGILPSQARKKRL